MKPRLAFLSAAEIAIPCLEFLRNDPTVTLCGIITQPERARGRGQTVSLNPIGAWAQMHDLPFYQAETMDDRAYDWLKQMQPDLILVMAFGHILEKRFLELPPLGMWNLHVSLLPKYRGASPIQTALLNGDTETGVTLMSMVEAMDAGSWLSQQMVTIASTDTAVTLKEKLARTSATLLRSSLPKLLSGNYTLTPQNESNVSYCKKIAKSDGCLDFSKSAIQLERCIRAYQPWPGAYFFKNNERYLVRQAHVITGEVSKNAPPASGLIKRKPLHDGDMTKNCRAIVEFSAFNSANSTYGVFLTDSNHTLLAVTTSSGLLAIDCIQKASGKPMGAAEFLRGNRSFPDAEVKFFVDA